MGKKAAIITRIAPSPTGNLHVGTARSALFNYLFAKKYGGSFIVRIENTDRERSKKEYEANILEGLTWLGLSYDALYRQSEREEVYKRAILKLINEDKAYISKEAGKEDPDKTVEVVRLKNPGKEITFTDLVRGDITFDTTELKDFVIARSVDDPLYHLAVVVDDYDMKITHIIRGEDHISNTPRQILIQEALGYPRPEYAHIPLILGSDRSKLSKRKGETAITEYSKEYLPEALVNYLALLGWNPGTEQELFSLKELTKVFDLDKVQKGGAVFDTKKLRSINQQYIKSMSESEFKRHVKSLIPKSFEKVQDNLLPLLQERVRTFKEAKEMFKSGELDFYIKKPTLDQSKISWKNESDGRAKEVLEKVADIIESTPNTEKDFLHALDDKVFAYALKEGKGTVLWPLRYALTGLEKSPDPFSIALALGKEEVLSRIRAAIALL